MGKPQFRHTYDAALLILFFVDGLDDDGRELPPPSRLILSSLLAKGMRTTNGELKIRCQPNILILHAAYLHSTISLIKLFSLKFTCLQAHFYLIADTCKCNTQNYHVNICLPSEEITMLQYQKYVITFYYLNISSPFHMLVPSPRDWSPTVCLN